MGMVLPGHGQARPGEFGDELAAREDPDVTALDVVIVVRKAPADPLRQPGGYGYRRHSAGPQDPGDLVHRALVGRQVLKHLGGDDLVERAVGERDTGSVAGDRLAR